MNSLSWFLYLAEVVGNVQGIMIALAVITLIMGCITGVIYLMTLDYANDELHPTVKRWFPRFVSASILAALLAALIPSQQTVYLIAASETGEKAYDSVTGQKAIAAINRYLDSVGVHDDTKK